MQPSRRGEVGQDLPVHARIARRRDGLLEPHAAAFAGGDRSFVLFLQRAGQDDVGVPRGFRQEKIDASEKLQLLERGPRAVGVGNGDQRIEADGQQAADLSRFDRIEDLARSQPCPRKFGFRDAPEVGDEFAVFGIFDVARARAVDCSAGRVRVRPGRFPGR